MENPDSPQPLLSTFAHDFETTIHSYTTPNQLRGVLNFAALLHEVVYLHDTAIGDNPHIISAFFQQPHGELYSTIEQFIKHGVLKVLVRDKVSIGQNIIVPSQPTITEIYEGWRRRGPDSSFLLREFGLARNEYNRSIDSLLFVQKPSAVQWYDPDFIKQDFRTRIQWLANSNNEYSNLLKTTLPREDLSNIFNIFDKQKYFTNADLWAITSRIPNSSDLVSAQAHINQQCYADYVAAGMTGSDHARMPLSWFNWVINTGKQLELNVNVPKSLDELYEQSEVTLSVPAIELLGLLTVNQIIELRQKAEMTIFKLAREIYSSKVLPNVFTQGVIEYWEYVCKFIEQHYPNQALQKTRLGIFIEQRMPRVDPKISDSLLTLSFRYLVSPYIPKGPFENEIELAASLVATQAAKPILQIISFRLLYERSPATYEIRKLLTPTSWSVNKNWSTNNWQINPQNK